MKFQTRIANSLLLILPSVLSLRIYDYDIDEAIKDFKDSIASIRKHQEEERRTIFATGKWEYVKSWSDATKLVNSAYVIGLSATLKLDSSVPIIDEFEILNQGLIAFNRRIRNRNLTATENGNNLSIQFQPEELFENGTMTNSPKSRRYLPMIGALYNANYNSQLMTHKIIEACQLFNPLQIIKNYVYEMDVRAGVDVVSKLLYIAELARLEGRAANDRMNIYSQGIMLAECLALSQKPDLKHQQPKAISEALPHIVAALNLLQAKYLNAAKFLNTHMEL